MIHSNMLLQQRYQSCVKKSKRTQIRLCQHLLVPHSKESDERDQVRPESLPHVIEDGRI